MLSKYLPLRQTARQKKWIGETRELLWATSDGADGGIRSKGEIYRVEAEAETSEVGCRVRAEETGREGGVEGLQTSKCDDDMEILAQLWKSIVQQA